ncbi:MAG: hypothetical protein IJX81_01975 [Clostridia bacterium]|nr:hypothetical protein [Clostridia bacterium]
MLKNYVTPDVKVTSLETSDIVTASGVTDGVGLQWKSEWGETLFGE